MLTKSGVPNLRCQTTWILPLAICSCFFGAAVAEEEVPKLTPEQLAMPRRAIAFPDGGDLLWIFNGQSRLMPRRYSLSAFNWSGCEFHLDFIDRRTGITIRDDVHKIHTIECPLGWNWRPGNPYSLLPQRETWYPYRYHRVGTFHKHVSVSKAWASKGETTPQLELTWEQPVSIAKIVLYDRIPFSDNAIEVNVTFSDGSQVALKDIPVDGRPARVEFSERKVTWAKFEVIRGVGPNVGLSEVEVYGTEGETNLALNARAAASSEYDELFGASNAIDGTKPPTEGRGPLLSFRIETDTILAAKPDEAYQAITITNRTDDPLELKLAPQLNNHRAWADNGWRAAADIQDRDEEGWLWTIPPHESATRHVSVMRPGATNHAMHRTDLAGAVRQADADGRKRYTEISSRLPTLTSDCAHVDDFYRRCIGSMALCRFDRDDYYRNPLWLVGGYMTRVAWDFSFSADVLAMTDPEGLEYLIVDAMNLGRGQHSWISPEGIAGDTLYIQEPFALQTMINAYMLHTGDREFLDKHAGDRTIYAWMKRWAEILNDYATGPDGLLDLGYHTGILIEVRTDGYDHMVPVVNILAADFYRQLSEWAAQQGESALSKQYAARADQLRKANTKHLWNQEQGWFDNLHPDGKKTTFWTVHLFDALSTDAITAQQRTALVSHLNEQEFLGELGVYSVSLADDVHWDLMDTDFGGGGCFIGEPMRLARSLYAHGDPARGWDVLRRVARQTHHFPYFPQASRIDEAYEHFAAGNLNISCAGFLEAIWYGPFGIRPQLDGSLSISPVPCKELGQATLRDFRFRGSSYDVVLQAGDYEVRRDGKSLGHFKYGTPWTSKR
jgi:hypothetical protein